MPPRDEKGRFIKGHRYSPETEFNREDTIKRNKSLKQRMAVSRAHKGKTISKEARKKMSEAKKRLYENGYTNPFQGKTHDKETRERLSELGKQRDNSKQVEAMIKANLSREYSEEHKRNISEALTGKPRYYARGGSSESWEEDESGLLKRQQRNDSAYQSWRRKVYKRDKFECKINNKDCSDRIEAHHILRWSEHPELRYEVNNGITLCQAHHPRKRAEEVELAPVFKEMISATTD